MEGGYISVILPVHEQWLGLACQGPGQQEGLAGLPTPGTARTLGWGPVASETEAQRGPSCYNGDFERLLILSLHISKLHHPWKHSSDYLFLK